MSRKETNSRELACGDRNANRRHANAHRIALTVRGSCIAFTRRVANGFA
jgi:hypothetical protein